jgi:hypothetical protein
MQKSVDEPNKSLFAMSRYINSILTFVSLVKTTTKSEFGIQYRDKSNNVFLRESISMKKKAITSLSSVIGKPIRETERSQKIAYILRNDLFPRDRIIKQQIELIKERKT